LSYSMLDNDTHESEHPREPADEHYTDAQDHKAPRGYVVVIAKMSPR
jgi:hypothetical protein